MDRSSPVAQLRAALVGFVDTHHIGRPWCVALSGGPDSLALTAIAAGLRPTTALIVDHGLQPGSGGVAATAQEQAMSLGCVAARVLPVKVGSVGGPEAAARTARYRALDAARDGKPVLLGHTLDDQAETVLLGLGRGSGARSIAGMRPYDPPWCRPLLGVRRSVTRGVCDALSVTAWQDPHNVDPRYTRVRLRTEVLPLLEDVLGGGVAEALARTATALREDTDALDGLAADAVPPGQSDLGVSALAPLPDALRRRAIRGWMLAAGARDVTDKHLRAVDALVVDWHGQGGVAVPGGLTRERLFVARRQNRLGMYREPVAQRQG